jgi:hypothetical protein
MAKWTLMVGLVDSGEAPDTKLTEPLVIRIDLALSD